MALRMRRNSSSSKKTNCGGLLPPHKHWPRGEFEYTIIHFDFQPGFLQIAVMHRSWTFAATSWLWPASLSENLRRIAAWDLPIAQASLLFYQTAPSLAYTPQELAARPGLTANVHLPLDLPWRSGPRAVWADIQALMAKAESLSAWAGVLHPPDDPDLMAAVGRLWRMDAPALAAAPGERPGPGPERPLAGHPGPGPAHMPGRGPPHGLWPALAPARPRRPAPGGDAPLLRPLA